MTQRFEYTVLDIIENASRIAKTTPLNLGGAGGAGGGVGVPPGGFIGQLPQYRVAYDTLEAATLDTLPSGVNGISGWSLVDNLNHIRYRIGVLESGGVSGSGTIIVKDWDGSPTVNDVNTIIFSGATVLDVGGGQVLVVVGSGGGGTSLTVMESDGSPSVSNVDTIKFSGATVTDLGSGDVLITVSGVQEQSINQISTNGSWALFSDPKAFYFNYKTYFSSIRADGSVFIGAFDHINNYTNSEFVLHSVLEVDDHDFPAILMRNSDKKLLAFYSKHIGAEMYLRISTDAEDISAFDTETDLASQIGKTEYTYSQPIQLIGETNEPIYLFSRDHTSPGGSQNRWFFSKSTNGGTTWSSAVDLFTTPTNRSGYLKAVQNGTERIDFFVSDGHPQFDSNVSLYHFYYRGGNYYKSDGVQISATLPLTQSDITQVYSGSTYSGWNWDISIGSDGNPVVAFVVFVSSADHRYYYGHWTGSTWSTGQIVAGGGGITGGEPYYSGGICLDHINSSIVYLSKPVSGQWELFRYYTEDKGLTWGSVKLTSNSTSVNHAPNCVRGRKNNDIAVLWLQGTYTSYTNYNQVIMRMGTWEDTSPLDLNGDNANSDVPANADKFWFWDVIDHIWKTITWSGIKSILDSAYISDAPFDGSTYGRKDGTWITISGTNEEILHYYNDDLSSQSGPVYSTTKIYESGTLRLYYNGIRQRKGIHYVDDVNFTTFSTYFPTYSGDTIIVDYDYYLSSQFSSFSLTDSDGIVIVDSDGIELTESI
jgi:hypothetical protein